MTKQEFISRQKAMTQSSNKRMIGWLVVFFGVLLGGVPLSRYVEQHEELTWLGPVFGIGLFVFLIGNLPLLAWFAKRQQRRFGIYCPSCGKPLVGLSAQVVIATGHCGHCGESVFSETKAGNQGAAAPS
jgi:hypothetical protein